MGGVPFNRRTPLNTTLIMDGR